MMPNLLHCFGNAPTPPITKVLSQYELLQSVCSTLSSADIIHLAATCKEHRTYITSSKTTLTKLLSTAHCDGRGIVAQARVFGYWKGDPSKAPEHAQCLGVDAKSCTSCGAHVCDNCRFHFYYEGRRGVLEIEFADEVEDEGMDFLGSRLPRQSIESGKAFGTFWRNRYSRFCREHEPLIIGFDNDYQTCRCMFYEHFVGSRWLCLPCFFVEEAKTYSIKAHEIIRFEEGGQRTSCYDRPGYIGVSLCDCGEHSHPKSIQVCRTCNGTIGWHRDRKEEILTKIYAQLG